MFYEEWIHLLKDFLRGKGLPVYSWNSFLGTDFWSSRAFHVIGNPFIFLFFLVDSVETATLIESILCVYISAVSMNLFLKEFGIKKQYVRNSISLIYAFSGWASLFIGQYMFHRFYALLPFLFYGAENFIQRKKIIGFILAVFILFLQNYYFMFPTTIFLFIYCLMSLRHKEITSYSEILLYAVQMIILYFVGFLLSAVLTVPAFLYLLQNERVGAQSLGGLFWEPQVYLGMILNFIISPFPVYTDYPNIFYSGTNGHAYWYSLFIGIIPTVSVISLL